MTSIVIVIQSKPYVENKAWDGVRFAGASIVEDLDVRVHMLGEAVELCKTNQQPPENHANLEQLLSEYIDDLTRLWDHLVRECRRAEPHRRRALTLARKIWQKQGLPQYNFLNESP